MTRAEAKAAGFKRYRSDVLCKYAHACERAVSDNKCVECVRITERASHARYNQTEKGKRTLARAAARYNASPKGRANRWKHAQLRRTDAEKRAGRAKYEHRRGLRRNYGMTPEDFNALATRQRYSCAICKSPDTAGKRRLVVDHDHATGAVRGLLCSLCNQGLGSFVDSKIHLRSAIAYLCSKNI